MTYRGTNLLCGVPDFDHLRITSYDQLSLSLLPVEYQSSHFGAGYHLCQSAEGGDQFDILKGVIVAEDANNAVGGAGKEESLVILVDETCFVDTAAKWVGVGEAGETLVCGPVPDAVHQY